MTVFETAMLKLRCLEVLSESKLQKADEFVDKILGEALASDEPAEPEEDFRATLSPHLDVVREKAAGQRANLHKGSSIDDIIEDFPTVDTIADTVSLPAGTRVMVKSVGLVDLVRSMACTDCVFFGTSKECSGKIEPCLGSDRADNVTVIFKEVNP